MVRADELFLIDSTFLFKASEAAFLGAPLLVDEEGRDHTRTFGVMRDLLRLRRMLGIRRAIVLVGEESVAATHKDVLDDLIPLLRQIGARVLRQDCSRVVDVCAQVGCSAQWIVSMNPAMQQLIADGLGVIIPHAGRDVEVVTRDRLNETGMRPVWVPAVLALSDGENAPLKRRQALRLLEIYGSLEAVLGDVSSAPSADWKRKLAPNAVGLLQVERGLRSWPVAIASPVPIDETSFVDDSKASTTALQAYGFWSLVRMLPAPDPIEIGDPTSGEGNKTDYRAVRSAEDLRSLEQCLAKADVCAIDTETSGKDPRTATLYGVSLAVREGQAFYVPLIQSDLDGLRPDDVRARLKVALSRRLKLVGHNLKYDFTVLHRHGIDVQELHFDTLLAAHECFGDWDFWNLSALAKKLLGAKVLRYREIVAKGETFLGRPFKELVEHACCDADMALRLYEVLTKELRKRGAEKQFADRAMRVERLLVERERDGVRIDVRRMRAAGRATKVRAEAMRAAVIAAGCEFDVDSPRSTTETLRKLGIWEQTSRPLGEAQMEQIAGDYPLVAEIVRYRRERRRSREIEAICAAAKKGRIYPSLSQCKFADDSLWSASPALEEAFAAGAVLDKAVEGLHTEAGECLKVLAEAGDDAVLRKDLGARKENDRLIPDVSVVGDREQRDAVLLIAIGEPLPVLSRRFLIGRAEAAKLRSAITSRYPALFRWLQEFKRAALANGFAEYRGRRKYLAGLRSSDLDKRNRALRAAVRWLATHPASDGRIAQ